MISAEIPQEAVVFLDANVFVYAFSPEPLYGPAALHLLERIECGEIKGVISSHVLSNAVHRLMSIEACTLFGWPFQSIAQRLKKHPEEIRKLHSFREAAETILQIGIQVLPVLDRHVLTAASNSSKLGLLSNDALIVTLMQENEISRIVTNDSDFDHIPDIERIRLQ